MLNNKALWLSSIKYKDDNIFGMKSMKTRDLGFELRSYKWRNNWIFVKLLRKRHVNNIFKKKKIKGML